MKEVQYDRGRDVRNGDGAVLHVRRVVLVLIEDKEDVAIERIFRDDILPKKK